MNSTQHTTRVIGLGEGVAQAVLGAMYSMGDQQNGSQIRERLPRWHSHLATCVNGQQTIAGFGVELRDGCNPATWRDNYTAQMLTVWVVPYRSGVFSDDLSAAATGAAPKAPWPITTNSAPRAMYTQLPRVQRCG